MEVICKGPVQEFFSFLFCRLEGVIESTNFADKSLPVTAALQAEKRCKIALLSRIQCWSDEELRGQGTSSHGIGSKILDQFTNKKLKVDMDVKTSIGIGVEGVKTGLLGVEVLCGGVTLKETNNEMPRCIISTLKWINIR